MQALSLSLSLRKSAGKSRFKKLHFFLPKLNTNCHLNYYLNDLNVSCLNEESVQERKLSPKICYMVQAYKGHSLA